MKLVLYRFNMHKTKAFGLYACALCDHMFGCFYLVSYYLNFEPRSNLWVCICYVINIWTRIFKTGILLPRLFCQNKYATKYITPCTHYIIYGRKLYNMIHVWVIYQFFFEPILLTICLIAMHCNGDILINQLKFQFSSNKIPICLITSIYN